MSESSKRKSRGLFLNQPQAQCSIYESGMMVFRALQLSELFDLEYFELTQESAGRIPPADFYLFNYHHATLPWLNTAQVRSLPGKVMTVILEVLPGNPFVYVSPDHFDAYIVLDPTIKHTNPAVYAFPRPLEATKEALPYQERERPWIGTFGFSTPGKGFELVVDAVNREFESALVRINIPVGTFWDGSDAEAHKQKSADYITRLCERVAKPGIEVQVTRDFLSKEQLIDWCGQNTLNCFLYCRDQAGLSATTDQCISAGRPLAVSANETFRHIHQYLRPYPELSLRESIASSVPNVLKMRDAWAPTNFSNRFAEVLCNLGLIQPSSAIIRWQQPQAAAATALSIGKHSSSVSSSIVQESIGLALKRNRSFVLASPAADPDRESGGIQINIGPEPISKSGNIETQITFPSSASVTSAALAPMIPLYCNELPISGKTRYGLFQVRPDITELEWFLSQITELGTGGEIAIELLPTPETASTSSTNNNSNFGAAAVHRLEIERLSNRAATILQAHPNFSLSVNSSISDSRQLLHSMAQCSAICFQRVEQHNAALFYHALAVQRPIAAEKLCLDTPSSFLRSSIETGETPLKTIIENGVANLVPLYNDWSEGRFGLSLQSRLAQASQSNLASKPHRPNSTTATYGIAVFHHIGDVLCCTTIAKQLKVNDPDCHITWFTSSPGEVAVRHNPYIDVIVVLEGDQYELDREIPSLRSSRPWTKFLSPATYLNYDAIPGGSQSNPRGTVFGIVKAAAQLNWTIPFIFPFKLAAEEVEETRQFWEKLPPGKKILVETDFRSEQSPWTDEWNYDMSEALAELDPVYIFTSKSRPVFLDTFLTKYPKAVWCNLPFRHNAELFNLADAFIGVSSGISCLTYSDYCRTDLPRIEVTRGEHWGAAELPHHTKLFLCYNRKRFTQALQSLKSLIRGDELVPRFDQISPFEPPISYSFGTGCCPSCGDRRLIDFSSPATKSCLTCGAVFKISATSEQSKIQVNLVGDQIQELSVEAFLGAADVKAESCHTATVLSPLGTVECLPALLSKLQLVLTKDGSLTVTTPNLEGVLPSKQIAQWSPNLDPKHRWLCTTRFIKELLIQSGFYIDSFSTLTTGNSKEKLIALLREANPTASNEQILSFSDQLDRHGHGDTIQITARKRGAYQGQIESVSLNSLSWSYYQSYLNPVPVSMTT